MAGASFVVPSAHARQEQRPALRCMELPWAKDSRGNRIVVAKTAEIEELSDHAYYQTVAAITVTQKYLQKKN